MPFFLFLKRKNHLIKLNNTMQDATFVADRTK